MRLPFSRKHTGALFVHPLNPAPRTVVLCAGFRASTAIRVFANGWSEHAARVFPCALAAPMNELRRLARKGIQLKYAVIVLTRLGEPGLEEEDRDLLWRAFGVPVFEQCLGEDNELLAAECEAHDGLHVAAGCREPMLETSVCGCGSSIPRRMPVFATSKLERIYSLVS